MGESSQGSDSARIADLPLQRLRQLPSTSPELAADSLPERAAAIGFAIPFLLFAAVSFRARIYDSGSSIEFTNARIARTFGAELVLSAAVGIWLWRRGWRPFRTTTRPFAWTDLLRGLGVWVATILAVWGWILFCRIAFPGISAVALQTRFGGHPSTWIVVPFVLFNAVFEELLWLSLGMIAFRRLGRSAAGALSVALRVAIHVYQGPLALLSIVPMGAAFTIYYLRTYRLWPLIIAHALQDLIAFAGLWTGISRKGMG